MTTKAFNILEEHNLDKRKKRRRKPPEILPEDYVPFDSVEDIHQEPGMYLDPQVQAELDKLLEDK